MQGTLAIEAETFRAEVISVLEEIIRGSYSHISHLVAHDYKGCKKREGNDECGRFWNWSPFGEDRILLWRLRLQRTSGILSPHLKPPQLILLKLLMAS